MEISQLSFRIPNFQTRPEKVHHIKTCYYWYAWLHYETYTKTNRHLEQLTHPNSFSLHGKEPVKMHELLAGADVVERKEAPSLEMVGLNS